MINLDSYKKAIDALSRTLKPLMQTQSLSIGNLADAIDEARKTCAKLDLESLTKMLDKEAESVSQRLDTALESRREHLLKAARQHEFPHKRFTDYDHIGPFKVCYRARTVQLELGSEPFDSTQEADGAKLFEIIRDKASQLEGESFSRESFFQTLRDAIRLAKITGQDQNGSVAIRTLYPLVVLVRQSRSEAFLKKPDSRTFKDYPLTQFLYDLARFGRDGWRCGEEILRTQTPNMATISQGKTLMLPGLDAQDGGNHRIALLWIEKREA